MKTTLIATALAAFMATPAAADNIASYGLGNESCKTSMTHDWEKDGEVQWCLGVFSAMAQLASPVQDMNPRDDDVYELIYLVRRRCLGHPDETLSNAAGTIGMTIIDEQRNHVVGAKKF